MEVKPMTDNERKLLLTLAENSMFWDQPQIDKVMACRDDVIAEQAFIAEQATVADAAIKLEAARVVQAETVGIDEDNFNAASVTGIGNLLVGAPVLNTFIFMSIDTGANHLSSDDALRLHAWLGAQLRKLGKL